MAHNASERRARGIADRRGDIYRWVFGHTMSAVEAAVRLVSTTSSTVLRHAASQRLLAACAKGDRAAAMPWCLASERRAGLKRGRCG